MSAPINLPRIFECSVSPGATLLLGLVYGIDGQPIVPTDVASVTVGIYDAITKVPIGSPFSVSVEETILDVPQTVLNSQPYNCTLAIDGFTYFADVASALVVAVVEPINGSAYPLAWKCNVVDMPMPAMLELSDS